MGATLPDGGGEEEDDESPLVEYNSMDSELNAIDDDVEIMTEADQGSNTSDDFLDEGLDDTCNSDPLLPDGLSD